MGGHILRRALDFEVDCQRNKWRQKMTWKNFEEQSMKVVLSREDALCRTIWIVGLIRLSLG